MGLFDGLFGSSEEKTELPEWVVGPAREMLQRSVDMGKAGYMPWTGPDVAALNRAERGAMDQNVAMANAFGMGGVRPNIPKPTDFGGGMWGYSSMPLYEQNLATLQEQRPGQMDYYNSFFVDPVTGAEGQRMQQSNLPTMIDEVRAREANGSRWGDSLSGDGNMAQHSGMNGDGRATVSNGGGLLGGYSGIGDMFDGGGPGQSGDTFGGALGGVSNALGKSPGGGLLGGLFG